MADPADRWLDEHAALLAQLSAWADAWRRRRDHGGAALVTLMSATHLGDPVATRIEKRLLLAKAHLEGRIAALAGGVAGAIARMGGDADTSAIERSVSDALVRVGAAEDDFGSKLAELAPIVETYRRLRGAIDGAR
jgi:hypothetical protein